MRDVLFAPHHMTQSIYGYGSKLDTPAIGW